MTKICALWLFFSIFEEVNVYVSDVLYSGAQKLVYFAGAQVQMLSLMFYMGK